MIIYLFAIGIVLCIFGVLILTISTTVDSTSEMTRGLLMTTTVAMFAVGACTATYGWMKMPAPIDVNNVYTPVSAPVSSPVSAPNDLPLTNCSGKIPVDAGTVMCTSSALCSLLEPPNLAMPNPEECTPIEASVTGLPNDKKCRTYIQRWYTVSERAFSVSWPTALNPPDKGWPFLIFFDFMSPTGLSQLWAGFPSNFEAGVSEELPKIGIDGETWYYLQTVFHGCLNKGIAIVCLSQTAPDTLRYMPSSLEAKAVGYDFSCDDSDHMCWTRENDDKSYLNEMITFLKHGVTSAAGSNVSFDVSRMSCMGYSVGAQMTSRMLESYVDVLPEGAVIKSAILIAGGSLFCYSYENPDKLPSVFSPCTYAEDVNRGCCPNDLTEPRYLRSGAGKPPVLLLQAKDDHYADTEAAAKYIHAVQKVGGSSACWVAYQGSLHGAYPAQAGVTVAFIINTLN